MSVNIDELLPTAKDFMKKLALAEAEEAGKQARRDAEADRLQRLAASRFDPRPVTHHMHRRAPMSFSRDSEI